MTNVQRLVYSILEFLEDQKQKLDNETAESLEVATECIAAAFGVDPSQPDQYRVEMKLVDIFNEGIGCMTEEDDFTILDPPAEVTPEARAEADRLKAQGNEFMKSERFEEARDAYTKAIQLDGTNAVYYCNRAAAFSKLEEHRHALRDCDRALRVEPGYGKAYGRKGLAHSALNEHREAIDCYTKALELDPDNQSYKNNLEVSKQKLQETPSQGPTGFSPGGGGFPPFGGMDLGAMMNNPAFMNMAQSLMSNPQMQQMMTGLMGNLAGNAQGQGGPAPDMSSILQMGQQFAQQVQQSNPELVEQMRRQAANLNSNPDQPPSGDNDNGDQS